ncbi:Importin-13 [Strongyloides ratti]|uniref:Importin-13 n=1 Tax=Strongyloides ratti TaxID=34506 RepID=A0A090MXA4_STRRB|nr:Importin-13 [Strongyloides ratti]CEF65089.1 Importin-13 [Strongyloides ratti]
MEQEKLNFIVKCVVEFYSSTNEQRRAELNNFLVQIQSDSTSWLYSFELLTGNYESSCKHFGSSILYTAIHDHFDEVAYKANEIRQFLVNILTESHHTLQFAVYNKLTLCLAIFILSTMPDIWANPFEELTVTWSSNPELLMKVLSDVAIAFQTIKLPLQQRNIVKSTLLTKSKAIIDITRTILCAPDSTPPIQAAGIDCVENWMKLPGACLEDWQHVFFIVLENKINDNVTCSRLITVVSENKEVRAYPKFCIAFIEFLATKLTPNFYNNIKMLNFNDFEDGDAEMALEDVCSLINSIVVFMTNVIDLIISSESYHTQSLPLLTQICDFFSSISNFPQPFPSKETFSDIPLEFWCNFRDALSCTKKQEIKQAFLKYFAHNLSYAIVKMSLPTRKDMLSKQEYEKFETYRMHRAQDSVTLYDLEPEETINFLINSLIQSYQEGDLIKAEAILYLFGDISDYFSETEKQQIETFLRINMEFLNSGGVKNFNTYEDVKRNYGENLMNSISKFSYLLFSEEYSDDNMIRNALGIGHYFMISHPETTSSALKYILGLVERQHPSLLPMADTLIGVCYSFFQNEELIENDRIDAMRIIGYLLSIRPLDFILQSLDTLVLPRIEFLKRFIRGEEDISKYSGNEFERKVLFEIKVTAAIIKTIQRKNKNNDSGETIINDMNGRTVIHSPPPRRHKKEPSNPEILSKTSPVYMILSQFAVDIPLLLQKFYTNESLMQRLTELLVSALNSLKEDVVHFGELYINVIDTLIYVHTKIASHLAKHFVIVTSKQEQLYIPIMDKINYWFSKVVDGSVTFTNEDDIVDIIDLSYHIMRKGLTMLQTGSVQPQTANFLRNIALICISTITTDNTNAKREAALTLKYWSKYIRDSQVTMIGDMVNSIIPQLIPPLIHEIQNRCISQNVLDAVTEILYTIFTYYKDKTDEVFVQMYPEGCDGLMGQIFKSPGNMKSFQLKVGILNKSVKNAKV